MAFIDYKSIRELFKSGLIKREIDKSIVRFITHEDVVFISEIGMPNELDCDFDCAISKRNDREISIGFKDGTILYNIVTRFVYVENEDNFLASSIKALIYQFYIVKDFWENTVKNGLLGNYIHEHKKYADHLAATLLKADKNIFINDKSYYWGSMIESIEFGIV